MKCSIDDDEFYALVGDRRFVRASRSSFLYDLVGVCPFTLLVDVAGVESFITDGCDPGAVAVDIYLV